MELYIVKNKMLSSEKQLFRLGFVKFYWKLLG